MLLLLENKIPESAFLGNQQKHMKSGNFPDLFTCLFKRGWGMVLTL